MKGRKHEEDLKIIIALYRDNDWKRFEMADAQRLIGAETIYAEVGARIKAEV